MIGTNQQKAGSKIDLTKIDTEVLEGALRILKEKEAGHDVNESRFTNVSE